MALLGVAQRLVGEWQDCTGLGARWLDPNQVISRQYRYCFQSFQGALAMSKPISDKAEVAVEYPDKLYIGTFAHSARFDAHLDQTGIALTLELPGPEDQRKSVHMHFHYALFAEILNDLAQTVAALPTDDLQHRESLRDAAKALYRALEGEPHKSKKSAAGMV
jgi:hypothetical protein